LEVPFGRQMAASLERSPAAPGAALRSPASPTSKRQCRSQASSRVLPPPSKSHAAIRTAVRTAGSSSTRQARPRTVRSTPCGCSERGLPTSARPTLVLRASLEPIPDGLPTGPAKRLPDEANRAGRTRARRDRAFVPYFGSSAPAVDSARAGNRRVTPWTTTGCCSSRDEAGKDNREQNCRLSHARSSRTRRSL